MDATNQSKNIPLFRTLLALTAAFALVTATGHAQLQWSSYNTSGALVTANVASGGDAAYGGTVAFTVPATTELVCMTKTFQPTNIAAASASAKINFNLSASGGLAPSNTGRVIGMGLLNDPGTPSSALDDTGYWTDLNTGNSPPSFELFYRLNTVTTFFQYDSSHKLGSGKTSSGTPTNGVLHGMQFQLNENSSANAISIGTSSSTFAACGAGITNSTGTVTIQSYSSANPLTTLATTTFNEFALMFNNQSASPVTVTVSGITLTPANPVISTQPLGYSGSPGDNTPASDFTVALNANSATPLSYQWYQATASATNQLTDGVTANGSTISGSTTASLSFSNGQMADSGNYFVVITNAYGAVTSAPAVLNLAPPSAPIISSVVPSSATVIAGQGTNFLVNATGSPSPVYLWYDNNSSLLQTTTLPTLTLNNLQLSGAGTYSVIASNSLGTATNTFAINIIVTPSISVQPTNLLLNLGDMATFAVSASGVPAPTFQWYKGSSLISGATNTSYVITNVAYTDIGSYKVVASNAAGTVTSSNAILAIYSATISGAPVAPANNATGVCYDTPLKLGFNQPPTVGSTGKIYIYNVNNSTTPVDTLDLSQNLANGTQSRTIAGDTFYTYPVMAIGNTAVIYPHLGVLTSNQTYYVTMDPGVLLDTNGAYFAGISATNAWQFTTKVGGPANPANMIVAQDYTGDFATVQGALDSLPANNSSLAYVNVRNGLYTEIVEFKKSNVVLRGQSRNGTIIGYANNSTLNANTHTRMAMKVNANNIALDNLTVTNSTAQDFSQAEALMIESGAAQIIVNNCNVDSYQDTILANISTSKAYFNNSLIQGDVDFIWGGGNLFFTNCEIRYLIRAANAAALGPNPSPGASDIFSNGFSFVNCALTTLPGANPNDTVGRTRSITNGNTALINCFVSTNIGGWSSDGLPVANYRNWYYGCTNDLGSSVTLSNGIALSSGDPNLALASSATAWLYGWSPALLPNITMQPTNLSATAGQAVSLVSSATGLPTPTYQWFKNGTNVPGATGSTLNIASAQRGDGASYYVVASNGSGSVTSSVVTLTYVNTAPVAQNFSMGTLVGQSSTVLVIGGKYAPTDADGDALTITGVSSASNGTASTDGNSITYTPTSGPGDTFTYTVSDGFGGTANGTVTVYTSANVQGYNLLSMNNVNGTNILAFAGIPTYNYALDMATNLTAPINWMPQVTNPAANNGALVFTNVPALPQSFYRTRYVP